VLRLFSGTIHLDTSVAFDIMANCPVATFPRHGTAAANQYVDEEDKARRNSIWIEDDGSRISLGRSQYMFYGTQFGISPCLLA